MLKENKQIIAATKYLIVLDLNSQDTVIEIYSLDIPLTFRLRSATN